MQLVFLPLQPVEKTFDPLVVVPGIAVENQAALFCGELSPRHVGRNPASAGPLFCALEEHPIARLGPRFDGPVVKRLTRIGHYQIQVEVDRVAEPLTARTRPVRIVKGEESGLGFLV